jgi:hypothetical protein
VNVSDSEGSHIGRTFRCLRCQAKEKCSKLGLSRGGDDGRF